MAPSARRLCDEDFPVVGFSPADFEMLQQITLTSSSLSLLGAGFILFTYYRFELNTFFFRLIVLLSTTDAAMALLYLVGISNHAPSAWKAHECAPSACLATATARQFFWTASLCWTACIAVHILAVLNTMRQMVQREEVLGGHHDHNHASSMGSIALDGSHAYDNVDDDHAHAGGSAGIEAGGAGVWRMGRLRMQLRLPSDPESNWCRYHRMSWGTALLLSTLLHVTGAAGYDRNWCWIRLDRPVARAMLQFLPLLLTMMLNMALYVRIVRLVDATVAAAAREAAVEGAVQNGGGEQPAVAADEGSRAVQRAQTQAKVVRRLGRYLTVFLLCNLFGFLNQARDLVHGNKEPSLLLSALEAAMAPLQGLGNAIVYGNNRRVKELYSEAYGDACAAACDWMSGMVRCVCGFSPFGIARIDDSGGADEGTVEMRRRPRGFAKLSGDDDAATPRGETSL